MKLPGGRRRPGNLLSDDYVRGLPVVTERKPGGLYVLVCYHDDSCPKSQDDARGRCTCTPDTELREVPEELNS